MRRPLILLLCALACWLMAELAGERPPNERLAAAASSLQARVDKATKALERRAAAVLALDTLPMGSAHATGEGGLRLYRGHGVAAWTDHAPIADTDLDTARGAHLVLPDGTYLHAQARDGTRSVHAVQRIWFLPPFENAFLHRQFDPGFHVEQGIQAAQGPGPVVRDNDGAVMFHLQWADGTAVPGLRSVVSIGLALAALACGIALLWLLSLRIRPRWLALMLFPVVLIGLRLALLARGSIPALAGFPLFDPSLFASSFFMPSLGDLLINGVVLLVAVAYFRQSISAFRPAAIPWQASIAALAILLASAAGLGGVMIALVHDSSVSLDLFRIQDLNGYSVAALLAIGLLLSAWSLFADAWVRLLGPRLTVRRALPLLAVGFGAAILADHWRGQYDLVMALWPLPVLGLLELMRRKPGTLQVLLLIAVVAGFTAHVLNRQTFKRLDVERAAIAETATMREDPVIELLFDEARRLMAADRALAQWLRSGAPCSSADLDRLVRQPYFTGYWDRYDLRLHLEDLAGRTRCSTSPDAATTALGALERFEQGVPVGHHDDLRITDRPGEDALYMGRIALDSAQLFVELRQNPVADGLGFPELLLAGQRPPPFKPGRFVQARFERGALSSASGPYVFPITWNRPVPPQGLHWTDGGYDLLARGDPKGSLLVLGSRIPTWWDHLTTFSYLFLCYCLLAGMAAGMGLLIRREQLASMGVGGQVRLGVAGFAMAGLMLFTFGMHRMVNVRQEQSSARTMHERTRGVLAELRQNLRGEESLSPSLAPYLEHLLVKFSNVFFTDLTLYGPDGLMLASSREQVFTAGLLGRRMDPRAFHRLAVTGASSFIHREHIGTASFSTAYMPFRNERGKVLAYLALPYFARQAEVDQERSMTLVALVNLFTLLFLLSVVAAALITHWTTRPLELLRRGLERIGLGAGNEPIPYRGNDELGQLVRVYNRKVAELRESAVKLARSEREHAWREMAKQVAHEIKNPLTPMKLNIQHFQRTWRPDLPGSKERLERFSNGLVEQIDALGRIAGEFSDFARMPRAQAGPLDLRELAAAAAALFAGQPEARVTLHPGPSLMVHADREHLLRVFNNLIKNALQAIPEGVPGEVGIRMRREQNNAVVEVRDNGTGIAEADRGSIFQPNFTTKSSGMGLGLAMVQRMVENAGGRVWFTTEEGKGSSFFVALPLESPDLP